MSICTTTTIWQKWIRFLFIDMMIIYGILNNHVTVIADSSSSSLFERRLSLLSSSTKSSFSTSLHPSSIITSSPSMVKKIITMVHRGGGGGGGGGQQNESYNNNNDNDDNNTDTTTTKTTNNEFEILDERIVYNRWRTLIQRDVRMRNGKIVNFDLVGTSNSASAVLIFAWDSKTKTVTLIREYMPGPNTICWGLAAGLVEEKHNKATTTTTTTSSSSSSDKEQQQQEEQVVLTAAQFELEEECHLTGGKWINLCNQPSCMDKYATTTLYAFLVIDPIKAINPRPLDDEEDITIVSGITIQQLLLYIKNGEFNVVGGWGALLAIEKLRELGEI